MPSDTYMVVRGAIQRKRIVVGMYDGCRREMCPYIIGSKDGIENCLFFQFAGESRRGLPAGGEWRCVHLAGLSIIEVREGAWHTGEGDRSKQRCVDHVDVEAAP
jgi:hypothetical protein